MDVIIDGDRNFALQGTPVDVLSALSAINDFLRAQGRAMMSLKVDGENIAAQDVAQGLAGKTPSQVGRLEITSESLSVLAADCLRELHDSVGDLPTVCHELAQVFQGESPEEGYEPFHQLAHIWGTIKSRQGMVVDALHLDPETFRIDTTTLRELHEDLNGVLEEAAQALQSGDCVLLGDLLEYELAPRAERERDIVALLQRQVPEATG